MNTQIYKFSAIIENPGGDGAFVTIPFYVEEVFGKKQVKIKALINGEPYRGTLVRRSGPNHLLLVLKEIHQKIGKDYGDEIEVKIEGAKRDQTRQNRINQSISMLVRGKQEL